MEPAPASVLLHVLARHARRQHASVALRAVAIGVIVVILAQPLLVGIDYGGASLALRWTSWVIALVASASAIAWHGRGLICRRRLVEVACDLEHRAAIGCGLLMAGASFSQQPPRDASPWMINRTVMLAAKAAADIRDWKRVSPVSWQVPTVAAVLGACVVVCAMFPAAQPWLARAAYPGCGSGRPGDLRVTAIGGDRRIAAGSEPELAVEVAGGMPAQVTASITWKDGRTEQRALSSVDGALVSAVLASGSRWHLTMPPITDDLTWQVMANRQPGGPARGESDRRRIELTPGLAPSGFHLRVIPPTYANLPDQMVTGDCAAVAGSQVELEATIRAAQSDSDLHPLLVAATVVIEPDDDAATTEIPATIDGTTLRANWIVRRSQRWGLRLIANGGNETMPDRHWRVTVANDVAPKIELAAAPTTMAADALATVKVTAVDDVALAETVLEVRRDHANGALLTSIPVSGNTPRQQQSEITIDGAALGLIKGESLALVPVARDRAGQTTRGEPTLITVTADGAEWDKLAACLARVGSATETASTELPTLSDAWDRCGQDPLAHTMLAGRLRSWGQALTDGCEPWPTLADVPMDRSARQAVADLSWWATHAIADVLAELTRVSKPNLDSAPPFVAGRLRLIADDLRHLTLMIQRQRDAVMRMQFKRAAVAEALAARHHAASLLADFIWLTPPPQGLIAEFSADDDHAALRAGGIEAPAVDERDVPGFGHDHVRIRWHGAIRVPRPDMALELTADDGVGLTIFGGERLPPEAWGDHAPTTWKSGPLAVGWLPLTIRWRQGTGGSLLRVAWTGSATVIAAEELRAVDAPDWLMTCDATAISAHSAALEHHLQQLALGVGPAAQALAAHRDGAWTAQSLTQVLTLADQVAGQQPEIAEVITASGPMAVSLDLANQALDRASSEPLSLNSERLSPSGSQALAVAWGWLAHAAESAGDVGSDKFNANFSASADLRLVESEYARLRKNAKPPTTEQRMTEPRIIELMRPAAILAGRDQARTALAVACGTLALELRETLPAQTSITEAIETLETRLRRTPAASEPPIMAGDATAVVEIQMHLAALVAGPARDAAIISLAQTPDGATDGAARRLASAIAHLSAASSRLERLIQRPITAPPAPARELPVPVQGVTDAGFSRARLPPPTLNDRGIDGFRPDQQSAIRIYLARMRQHTLGAP